MRKFLSLFIALILVGAALLGLVLCSRKDAIPETTAVTQETVAQTETGDVPTEPETPAEPYLVAKAHVGVTGDMLIHESLYAENAYQGNGVYNFDGSFQKIAAYYSSFDYMVANLEVTLAGAERGYSSYPIFNCPDALIDSLKSAGVDMLLTANNHSYDTGSFGYHRTLRVLQEKGMPHLGTQDSAEEQKFLVTNVNGIKIGQACYTYETPSSNGRKALNGIPVSVEDGALLNSFNYGDLESFYQNAAATLEQMKEMGAQITVFYMHWGTEYKFKENSYQDAMAQRLADLGVDIIVGGHPHVVQPFETITGKSGNETVCIYSLGNAISNQRQQYMVSEPTGHTEDGMIFSFELEKWSDGTVKISDVSVLPTWVYMYRVSGKRFYEILPLDPRVSDWSLLGIDDLASAKKSYNRTMEIVGEGLNAYRAAHGWEAIPVTVS